MSRAGYDFHHDKDKWKVYYDEAQLVGDNYKKQMEEIVAHRDQYMWSFDQLRYIKKGDDVQVKDFRRSGKELLPMGDRYRGARWLILQQFTNGYMVVNQTMIRPDKEVLNMRDNVFWVSNELVDDPKQPQ